MTTVSTAVERLFSAIESRDLRLLRDACVPEVSWRNVPESPVVGVDAVCSLIGTVTLPAEEVRWEIERLSWSGRRAHVERLDRFRIFGEWHEVWCHGVLLFAPDGRLVSLDDYVDLAEWRSRIGPVLGRIAARGASVVLSDLKHRPGSALERLGSVLSPEVVFESNVPVPGGRIEGWGAVVDALEVGPVDAAALCDRLEPDSMVVNSSEWTARSSGADGRTITVTLATSGGRVTKCVAAAL